MDSEQITTNICRDCLQAIGGLFSDIKDEFFLNCDLCFRDSKSCQSFKLAGDPAELQGDMNEP